MMRKIRSAFASLIAILCLAGCLGSAPSTRMYQLESVANRAGAEVPAKQVTIIVREIGLPKYLDRPQIVTRDAGHRIQLAEFDHWAGDLREDLTHILAENLGRLLRSERVFASPLNVAIQPDFRLNVEILRFERDAGGRVQLVARWYLSQSNGANVLASHEATFSGAVVAEGYPELIAVMSAVYGDLARAIADTVRKASGS